MGRRRIYATIRERELARNARRRAQYAAHKDEINRKRREARANESEAERAERRAYQNLMYAERKRRKAQEPAT
jgi:hypothetical protein